MPQPPDPTAAPEIVPCLWFDGQAEEAARFYASLAPDSHVDHVLHSPANYPGGKEGDALLVDFTLMGRRFTAINGGSGFAMNPSISFFLHTDTVDETNRIVAALADGGEVLMPLQAYPWSERYAWVQDRFGASWQVIMGRGEGLSRVVPCLMFANEQRGRAEEAMRLYTEVFPDARVELVDRYAPDEGPEDLVKHGRFTLAGQTFVAMDSHIPHAFDFNEGVSLQILCDDQADADRYLDALSAVPEAEQCGWLKDRFGVSWQVVPRVLTRLLADADREKARRVMEVMMPMKRLDVAQLEAAADGAGQVHVT